jgi:hypothetical protein
VDSADQAESDRDLESGSDPQAQQRGETGAGTGSLLERRAPLLLGIGAACGLALAAASLLGGAPSDGDPLPEGSVARVNQVLIPSDDFERLVAGLESDTRARADQATRRHVLDRMIDEELLVQRALDLGLARVDRRVRADLTNAMIASVVAGVEDQEPGEPELRRFHRENLDFFTVPGRLRVRQIFFRARNAEEERASRARAVEARRLLAEGGDFEALRSRLGDPEISPLPDALLPPGKLREYLGPTALRAALSLEVGAWSQPVRSGTGVHLLQLVDREAPRAPGFEESRKNLRAEWKRRAGDRALRAYLDELRKHAVVVTASSLP